MFVFGEINWIQLDWFVHWSHRIRSGHRPTIIWARFHRFPLPLPDRHPRPTTSTDASWRHLLACRCCCCCCRRRFVCFVPTLMTHRRDSDWNWIWDWVWAGSAATKQAQSRHHLDQSPHTSSAAIASNSNDCHRIEQTPFGNGVTRFRRYEDLKAGANAGESRLQFQIGIRVRIKLHNRTYLVISNLV